MSSPRVYRVTLSPVWAPGHFTSQSLSLHRTVRYCAVETLGEDIKRWEVDRRASSGMALRRSTVHPTPPVAQLSPIVLVQQRGTPRHGSPSRLEAGQVGRTTRYCQGSFRIKPMHRAHATFRAPVWAAVCDVLCSRVGCGRSSRAQGVPIEKSPFS